LPLNLLSGLVPSNIFALMENVPPPKQAQINNAAVLTTSFEHFKTSS